MNPYVADAADVNSPDDTVEPRNFAAELRALKSSVGGGGNSPRPVIIDTDWWTDVDDAVAIRVALEAERSGLIDIMACTINTALDKGPGSLDAMLYDAGRFGVPIGSHKTYVPTGSAPSYQSNMYDGKPHDLGPLVSVPTGVSVLRHTLASGSNGSVDIISIGYLTNLQELLLSTADAASPLTGIELVTQKVKHLWIMGGSWPNGAENNFNRDTVAAGAAASVISSWPTPITFMGFEVSNTVRTGGNLTSEVSSTDILRIALSDHGSSGGRFSWDPMMMRLAAIGTLTDAGYTAVYGTASVNAVTGVNSFIENNNGKHRYVVKAKSDQYYIDDINPRLVPGNWPAAVSRTPPLGSAQPLLPTRSTSTYLDSLIVDIDIADLVTLSNGVAINNWPNRAQSRYGFRAPASANRPILTTNIGMRTGVKGDTTKRMLTDSIQWGQNITVYALVYWSAIPVANQTVIAADDTLASRGFHLKSTSSAIAQSTNFIGNAGGTADGGAILANTWQVIGFRMNAAQLQTFVDGVAGTATARVNANVPKSPISLFTRYFDSQSEGGNNYLAKARVYLEYHSDSTIAAVTAELNAV